MDHIKSPTIEAEAQQQQPEKCSAAWVAERIVMLLSAYRRDDYSDPESFVVQLGTVLQTYPEWIVRYVTDPKTGVQRTCKFPPSIAEVVAACEELYGPIRRTNEWDARTQVQMAERASLPKPRRSAPAGRTVSWAEVQNMEKDGKKLRIHGPFDKERQIPYRG